MLLGAMAILWADSVRPAACRTESMLLQLCRSLEVFSAEYRSCGTLATMPS